MGVLPDVGDPATGGMRRRIVRLSDTEECDPRVIGPLMIPPFRLPATGAANPACEIIAGLRSPRQQMAPRPVEGPPAVMGFALS